jgi:hypothetical protein
MKKTINVMLIGLALIFLSATCNRETKPKVEKEEVVDKEPKELVDKDLKEVIDKTLAKFTVHGKLFIFEPYCGGAAPNHEITKKQNNPYSNQEVFIKPGTENDGTTKGLISVTTLEDGSFEVELAKGSYCLIQAYKNQPFEGFLKQFDKDYDRFYIKQGKDCYENWWKSCDLSFEMTEEGATLEHTFRKRCFVGENPCIEYNGPMPP